MPTVDEQQPAPILPPARTPKEKFLRGPHRKEHELWTDTAAAKSAMEVALAEYLDGFGEHGDEATAVQCYNRLLGARKVLQILANLHLPDPEPKKEQFKTLRAPS